MFVPRSRTEVLNYFADRFLYKRYLEIGVQDPFANLVHIRCASKTGVDVDRPVLLPQDGAFYHQRSDDFFAGHTYETWDLIFVDGDHSLEQVRRDVSNALLHLGPNGTIVMHDVNPITEQEQLPAIQGIWCGEVWKAWAEMRTYRDDLRMFCVDVDHGCGVVRRSRHPQPLWPELPAPLTYQYLETYRQALLNLIPAERLEQALGCG